VASQPRAPPRLRSCDWDWWGSVGGEVDHRRATDGQHHSQNQPTSVNDDKRWNLCELRVFNGNQRCSITVGWHSQGGSAGSNPVGATHITAGQRRCGAGCEQPLGVPFLSLGNSCATAASTGLAKLAIGPGGLLISEQGALTSYRRSWGARSGHVDRQNLNSALGNSPAGTETGCPERDHFMGSTGLFLAGWWW